MQGGFVTEDVLENSLGSDRVPEAGAIYPDGGAIYPDGGAIYPDGGA
jgi:hypothetical protein